MGGSYVNDFVNNGRVKKRLRAGRHAFRMQPDSDRWYVRNANSEMVPFSAFSSSRWTYGSPQLSALQRHVELRVHRRSGRGRELGRRHGRGGTQVMKQLPPGIGYEWAGSSYQERLSGAQAPLLYAVSILFVFLCLAALYESWSVPFSVILVVPLGVLGAVLFTRFAGLSNDVYFQVGLLATVGLSSKNAILIVEFAKQLQERGHGRARRHAAGGAAAAAAHPHDLAGLRLRRAAAGAGHRRGLGQPPVDRRGACWAAWWRHGAGHLLRAAVLRADPRLASRPGQPPNLNFNPRRTDCRPHTRTGGH
jgi:multidrug efflux pump subunit AcrB